MHGLTHDSATLGGRGGRCEADVGMSDERSGRDQRQLLYGKLARICLVFGIAGVLSSACAGEKHAPKEPRESGYWSNSPSVCGADQVREYFCDDLLPLSSSLPAPEPFSDCPGSIDHHVGLHQPRPPVAVFDAGYTKQTRARVAPGHSCCYSWCAPLRIQSLSDALPDGGCRRASVFRETYCIPELESGTSYPAPSPLSACPLAIKPPAGAAFAVPPAAPLDLNETQRRRAAGQRQCCYGWCSENPSGENLQR